jgi:hypothetical protein
MARGLFVPTLSASTTFWTSVVAITGVLRFTGWLATAVMAAAVVGVLVMAGR